MKTFYRLFAFLTLVTLSSGINGQSLALKLNASLSALGEVEATFITPGISIEGKAGRHWTLGIDLGAGSNSTYKMLHFTPAVKYYVNRSLQGFYLGIGMDAFRLKRENGGPIGYPFDNDTSLTGVAAGPKLMVGTQTIINDMIAIGFQLGAGPAAGIESGFFHGIFSVGIAL